MCKSAAIVCVYSALSENDQSMGRVIDGVVRRVIDGLVSRVDDEVVCRVIGGFVRSY